MAIIRLTPSTYELSSTSYLLINNASNMYNNTDNTTYATITHNRSQTTTYYLYLRGFNFDSIPSNATVNSFTVKLKANQSGLATGDNYKPYLANGTTAENGSCPSIGTTVDTYTFTGLSETWNQIKEWGSNFGIRISCRRSSRNTTGYLYVYGAEIEVNINLSQHTVTSVNNSNRVTSISPSGSTTIYEGQDYSLTINIDNINNVIVTDNGNDVTSQTIQEYNHTDYQISTVLGEYTLISGTFSSSGGTYFSGIVGNGDDVTSTTASNYYSSNSGTIVVFTYDMSFTNIPQNAVINRLYCKVNGHAESTSQSNEYMCVQLRSGDTELSSEYNFKSAETTGNTTQTIEATTLPTVSQLSNLVLYCRLGYYGGALNGATCYLEYTIESQGYHYTYTIANVITDHTIVITDNNVSKTVLFKNNGWVEALDLLKKSGTQWNSIMYSKIWVHNGTLWVEDAQRTIEGKGIVFKGNIINS